MKPKNNYAISFYIKKEDAEKWQKFLFTEQKLLMAHYCEWELGDEEYIGRKQFRNVWQNAWYWLTHYEKKKSSYLNELKLYALKEYNRVLTAEEIRAAYEEEYK